jgi:hypothetical protein
MEAASASRILERIVYVVQQFVPGVGSNGNVNWLGAQVLMELVPRLLIHGSQSERTKYFSHLSNGEQSFPVAAP